MAGRCGQRRPGDRERILLRAAAIHDPLDNGPTVLFRTTPADHHALQAEIDAELAVDPPSDAAPGSILTWMSAHGAAWLETYKVLREDDYADFDSELPTNRAAVRIQDRLSVVSPGEPRQWLTVRYPELGGERPLDLLERNCAAPVLILLDDLALSAPDHDEAREREAMLRAFRQAESRLARAKRPGDPDS